MDAVLAAVADDGLDAGISIHAELEPLGGPGTPVKPAIYAGGLYQVERRWWNGGDEPVEAVVIDNAPSEANRMEQALRRLREALGLPVFELDLSQLGQLPPHVPSTLTSFDFPHRHADAYLRDAVVADTGEPFLSSEIGAALVVASATNPVALLQWMPQSLIYGFWQSHLGKRGAQTKFARAVDAEIVGFQPASIDTRRFGLKGDPLNLSIDDAVTYDEDDHRSWEVLDGARSGTKKSKDSLAEIGHGQVPVGGDSAPLSAVSFRGIEQSVTISFARLRTIETGDPKVNAAARAVLATLALTAAEAAFSSSFTLRSGCDLRPTSRSVTWRGRSGDDPVDALDIDAAIELFRAAASHAADLGLPVGPAWATEPVRLLPNASLAKVITATFGLAGA